MFGLELRKKGQLSNIYRDVDSILKSNNIPSGGITKDLVREGVGHSLFKMLKSDNYFSICTVDSCIKVSGIIIQRERYNFYHSQHCVHWNEMLPEFREKFIAMLLDDFRSVLTYEEEKEIKEIQIEQ